MVVGRSHRSSWRRYFEAAAERYDEEDFTQATDAEVAQLRSLLDLLPGQRVLDIGCGTGRHAVPLATLGLQVTGVDLSPAMLERAAARAAAAGVELDLITADARHLPDHLGGFDVALCLCEGAFCLVADGVEPLAHDRAVLASIHRALRPGGRLVLTGLHAARLLAAWQRGEPTGTLDLLTLTETSQHQLDDGSVVELREHYHLPDGLRTLAESVGFAVEAVWAGGAGYWRREPPTVDDFELMLVARRP
ncbi:MAG: class I SAM-dependent methyltransferase [Nitriliruptor sp.]|nr:MAG: class I SAM-dependent methyltransferase [Nitriliruptor sp.]